MSSRPAVSTRAPPVRSTPAPWYLPYKSTDGGQSWKTIKNGIIDDSDIFAIDIDPATLITSSRLPAVEFMKLAMPVTSWTKVQGIPSQSREDARHRPTPVYPGLVSPVPRKASGVRSVVAEGRLVDGNLPRQPEVNSIAIHPSRPPRRSISRHKQLRLMVSTDGGKTLYPPTEDTAVDLPT
mgnify:CR=1 FL=1